MVPVAVAGATVIAGLAVGVGVLETEVCGGAVLVAVVKAPASVGVRVDGAVVAVRSGVNVCPTVGVAPCPPPGESPHAAASAPSRMIHLPLFLPLTVPVPPNAMRRFMSFVRRRAPNKPPNRTAKTSREQADQLPARHLHRVMLASSSR
jgi:hypothetical protein